MPRKLEKKIKELKNEVKVLRKEKGDVTVALQVVLSHVLEEDTVQARLTAGETILEIAAAEYPSDAFRDKVVVEDNDTDEVPDDADGAVDPEPVDNMVTTENLIDEGEDNARGEEGTDQEASTGDHSPEPSEAND